MGLRSMSPKPLAQNQDRVLGARWAQGIHGLRPLRLPTAQCSRGSGDQTSMRRPEGDRGGQQPPDRRSGHREWSVTLSPRGAPVGKYITQHVKGRVLQAC